MSNILSTGAGLRWLRSVPLIPSPQQHHAALQVPASIFIDNLLMLLLMVVNKTQHPHLQMKNQNILAMIVMMMKTLKVMIVD